MTEETRDDILMWIRFTVFAVACCIPFAGFLYLGL